jgi:glucosylceramidase
MLRHFFYAIILVFHSRIAAQTAQMWLSSEWLPAQSVWFTAPPAESAIPYRLSRQADIPFNDTTTEPLLTFHIRPEQTFQTMRGIGTSLEETSVYAILKNKTEQQQRELLRALIDPVEGIGLNLFRITIGTSDFSDGRKVSAHPKGFYTYQESETDLFSIENDLNLGIVHTLQMANRVAAACTPPQELEFFASCWSPPGWMKTSSSLIGGSLREGYEPRLALYFRQFLESYHQHGIRISAITLQNEPNFAPDDYPGMKLSVEQQLNLTIAVHQEFQKKPVLSTAIWIHDHNFGGWENADHILKQLKQRGLSHIVEATAFHSYDNRPPEIMSKLRARHPDKEIVFSEHSEWGSSGMYHLQRYFWNWSTTYTYWVTMSTQSPAEHNQGPYNTIDMLGPTMLIKTDGDNPDWYRTPEYYLIGQFSKFIKRRGRRIGCEQGSPATCTAVAFQNPDREIVAVLVNQTITSQSCRLHFRSKAAVVNVPAKTVATLRWR